jgi:single-stranded-DNA-specific exonuclease
MQLIERPANSIIQQQLQQSGIHPLLAKLWASRGVNTPEDALLELKSLMPPSELKGCIEAGVYLADAFSAKKNILIIADYDCDGATACAVGILGLEELGMTFGAKISFIVPNRFTMGYGLTPEVVEMAFQHFPRPDILITVDNGIASIPGIERANELGMEVLVTDHHLPADELPKAKLIVNPNQPECAFRSKSLAGVGVMFYVLLALRSELRKRGVFDQQNQPKIEKLLDFVALGTVADVASLDRNNRILVSAGLRRIRAGQMHPGIQALFEVSARDHTRSNTFDLGFGLGPRLNAAGRLADMSLGIRCLISQDISSASQLAHELDHMNRERREIEGDMKDTAIDNLAEFEHEHFYTLSLFDPTWHQGVIGILASRLKEKYHRPVIIFAPAEETTTNGNMVLKGSGRSITGFHLRDALDVVSKKHPHIITKFGGHAMAAGLSIAHENLEEFTKAFETVAQQWMTEDTLSRRLMHDGEIPVEMINADVADQLSNEIWGQGFPEPIFTGNFQVLKQTLLKEKHLKLELKPIGTNLPKPLLGIWFNHNEPLPNEVRFAYRLLVDRFLGYPRAQLHIEAAYNVTGE